MASSRKKSSKGKKDSSFKKKLLGSGDEARKRRNTLARRVRKMADKKSAKKKGSRKGAGKAAGKVGKKKATKKKAKVRGTASTKRSKGGDLYDRLLDAALVVTGAVEGRYRKNPKLGMFVELNEKYLPCLMRGKSIEDIVEYAERYQSTISQVFFKFAATDRQPNVSLKEALSYGRRVMDACGYGYGDAITKEVLKEIGKAFGGE